MKKSQHGGRRPGAGRRPGIPNKTNQALKELAGQHTEDAVKVLVEVMKDEAAPHSARVAAADKLLDRGHGRPAVFVDASVSGKLDAEMLHRLETEMMERMERSRQRQLAVLEERGIEDDE